MAVYARLLEHFGPQHWWPGETPLEVMVGAVLTQNTAWVNVERAIDALRAAGELSLEALVRITEEDLARRIRPAGYFRVKARRLKNLILTAHGLGDGDLDAFLARPTDELRQTLLAVSGVGPETADSILLYAAQRPVFVVDAYTRRALLRHRWILPQARYREIQSVFMKHLPPDVALYNEYHALWVAVGKTWCRPTPRCAGCPLEGFPPLRHPRAWD
jgi:endonuclease-3 related protein